MIPVLVKIAAGLGALWFLTKDSSSGADRHASLAENVAADIMAKGPGYDRTQLKAFQTMAGIAVDGLYGPESAAALSRALGREAPSPIFLPAPEQPSHEPLTLTDQQQAREIANKVDQDLRAHGAGYDHELLKSFQRLARPLYPDGKYGPVTAGALAYFTDRVPPTPIFSGSGGNRAVVPYQPPK